MIAQTITPHQFISPADAAQHAEREHIDLHQAQRIDVVLIPFDEATIRHRGIMDGHRFIQPVLGQHKAADMLGQMPGERRSDQLLNQRSQPQYLRIVERKARVNEAPIAQVA